MSSNEIAGSFLALRGENCNFTNVGGLKSLCTENGLDLVTLVTTFENRCKVLEHKISELEKNSKAAGTGPAGPAGSAGSDEDDRLAVAATDYYVCLPEPEQDEQVVQDTAEPKKMWYPP